MPNPLCGVGKYDRDDEPCILHKCWPGSWMTYVHYAGTENTLNLILMFLFPIFGLFVNWPLRQPGDNQSTDPETNQFFAKGCCDRERQPPHVVKLGSGCHYAGICSLPGLLELLAPPPFRFILLCLTFPTDTSKGAPVVVAAPVAGTYGATEVRGSAAERGSRR